MTQAIELNTLNNIETMFDTKQKDVSSKEFSAILDKNLTDKKIKNEPSTLGDIKNSSTDKSNKLAEFKSILDETIEEENAETSLDLTLEKEVVFPSESELVSDNTETQEESVNVEQAVSQDNVLQESILQAQILEPASQTPVKESTQPQLVEAMKTLPQTEAKPVDITQKSDVSELPDTQLDEDMIKELNIESVEADTGSSSNDASLMSRQSPEEQGIKILINQEVKSFEVQPSEQQVQADNKPVEVTPSKIIEQVTKHLETLQNTSKVSLVLNPESLGKITIQLVKSPEGLSAQFTTATQEARNILMNGLDGLKDTLVSHGVGVDNVSVKVNDSQKSEYNSDWTDREGSRGGNKGQQGRSNRDEKEKGLFERTIAQQNENGKV